MGSFDININPEVEKTPIRPPWTLRSGSAPAMIEWFTETLPILEKLSEYRITSQANNLLWYTGEFDRTLEYRFTAPGYRDANIPHRILPRIFSHLTDLIERRVANLSRYKPAFDCVPTNQEERDRTNARLLKISLSALVRREQLDLLLQALERWNGVFGEVLAGVEWDPNYGDRVGIHSIDRIGDVRVYLKEPWTYLPEPKRKWEDVSWLIDLYEVSNIDEVRQKYSVKSLEPDNRSTIYTFNEGIHEKREDEVVVYRVIQRPTQFIPKGRITYIACGKVLDDITEYPYSHYGFPFERHTDIDVPGRLFPISYLQLIKPVQHVYNKLTSTMVRNMLLVGHPHILLPTASGAKVEDFGNRPTAIKFNGQIEPKVLTFSSVPGEFFKFRSEAKEEMGQIYGIQGVSRGDPPKGARAGSMLKFYEEQEQLRQSTQIIKHNELIRKILLKAASIMGEYYPQNKNRMIRVLGRENQYQIEKFAETKFSAEYDVIIQNSTGFSDSMAGRLEEIGLLQQYCPGLLSPEQIMDVLSLKNPQRAYDIATAAIREAGEENERFLVGQAVPAPKEYQDLIVHWREHMILFNSSTWDISVPQSIKEPAFRHMLATEMLMSEKAKTNPTFAKALEGIGMFPAFWHPEEAAPAQSPVSEAPAAAPAPQPPAPMPLEMPPTGQPVME